MRKYRLKKSVWTVNCSDLNDSRIIVVNLYGLKYNVQIDEVEDVINRYGIRYGRTNEKSECV